MSWDTGRKRLCTRFRFCFDNKFSPKLRQVVEQNRMFWMTKKPTVGLLYENFPRAHTAREMLFDRQTPSLREENNVLSVFGKIE